ncbi:MAG: hypothetical protein AseanaTS_01900 [Candidatus Pelagadaptatus aseana]|uniref:sterol desaturase family protein n=1 Tax=Candidatus Pelagadaptatus aseana TaxID=3120508 RepID=UPI0039B203CC
MQDFLIHASLFLAIVIAFVLVLVSYENWYWSKRDNSKTLGLKEVLSNFSLGSSYKLIDAVVIALTVVLFYDEIKSFGLNLAMGDQWYMWLVTFFAVDLGFYVLHLTMHKVRWFWTSHVTHHSSDRYNYSVALRQNFTIALNGTMLILWVPAALIGFDMNMVLLALEINLLYQFLLHTEMPSPLDRLGLIFNTPSHHRVHHGCKPEQIDTNFGGTLIIWDRLFGTFVSEQDAGELSYGITRNQPRSYNPFTLLFHEWRDMLADLWQTRDLRVLWKGPGWIDQRQTDKSQAPSETANTL